MLKKKILLVEDNEMNSDPLSRLLKRRKYEVILARDGKSAVDKALAIKPDLILMDINLPVQDGYVATREIRKQGYDGPIIAVTAHALMQDRDAALISGCDAFITKPLEIVTLLELIKKFTKA